MMMKQKKNLACLVYDGFFKKLTFVNEQQKKERKGKKNKEIKTLKMLNECLIYPMK